MATRQTRKSTASKADTTAKTETVEATTTEEADEATTDEAEKAPAEQLEPLTVMLVDGTEVEVPARRYAKEHSMRFLFNKKGERNFGHEPGVYANHEDDVVREAAYNWRASGKSVNAGYTALKLQAGAYLAQAADAWAEAQELEDIKVVRKEAIAASKPPVEVTEDDAASIDPAKEKAEA